MVLEILSGICPLSKELSNPLCSNCYYLRDETSVNDSRCPFPCVYILEWDLLCRVFRVRTSNGLSYSDNRLLLRADLNGNNIERHYDETQISEHFITSHYDEEL